MGKTLCSCLILAILSPAAILAEETVGDPMARPAIKAFLAEGFGARHEKAPAQTEQFGRFVGLWHVDAEMARMGGGWEKTAPGIWAWKYTLGGFAVSDLWFQGADNLPSYMANLGRDYLLNGNRIYNMAAGKWHVSWMANGAGTVMGADVGTFTAELEGEDIVMTSPADAMGLQRVVFSEITDASFRWRSEYSTDDGKTWITVMRMKATRFRH